MSISTDTFWNRIFKKKETEIILKMKSPPPPPKYTLGTWGRIIISDPGDEVNHIMTK